MVFIGREKELNLIRSTFESCISDNKGAFISILGNGGIGKTSLLHQIVSTASLLGYNTSGVINLSETANQTPLLLAERIANSLGKDKFPLYEKLMLEHHEAELEKKFFVEIDAINIFAQELIRASHEQPILIALDTAESIVGKRLFEWLFNEFIGEIISSIVVIVAGRQISIPLSQNLNIQLEKFNLTEIKVLAQALFNERGELFELSDDEIEKIFQKTQGSPIISTLAIEWILETGELESILSISNAEFERKLALRFIFLKDKEENTVIKLLAILDRRFNSEIYAKMVSLDANGREQVLSNIRRFSFVKYKADSGDLTLHDEMRNLLQTHEAIPQELFLKTRIDVVEYYYKPILRAGNLRQIYRQPIVLDVIYYMLSYAPDESFVFFDEEFNAAFLEYEFTYCRNLLSLMHSVTWSNYQLNLLDILEGELLLRQYNPFAAARIFEKLCATDAVIIDSKLMSRAFEGLGNCLILGCQMSGQNMSNALEYLQKALTLSEATGEVSRSATILLEIGIVMFALGRHNDSLEYFDRSIKSALATNDYRLAANVTDYFIELLQLTGKLFEGREWGIKGLEWRKKLGDSKDIVFSYRKLASSFAYGAQNDEDRQISLEYYDRAIKLCTEMNDHLGLADVYQSLGWAYFKVLNNNDEARICAEKGLEICNRYGFGRIKAMLLALKFDMADARGDLNTAIPLLEESLAMLRTHGEIYHLLHLLSHKVLIAKQTKRYDEIPLCIEEMEGYIQKGAGFRVFYGRSLIVWGDCALEDHQYAVAFDRYHKGYQNLALAGQHTAWEAWGTYKQHIKERLPRVFEQLNEHEQHKMSRSFIKFWQSSGLASSHPELIEVCKAYSN